MHLHYMPFAMPIVKTYKVMPASGLRAARSGCASPRSARLPGPLASHFNLPFVWDLGETTL